MAFATSYKKKPKKNAFFMFMEEKRSMVEASGVQLTRGFAQLATLVSDEWKTLSPDEKKVYEERARKYNGVREDVQVASSKGQKKQLPQEDDDQYYLRTEKEARTKEFEKQRLENRALVWKMFETDDWMSKPIVVCNFSKFFEPRPHSLIDEFIPAEIGLTAFSLTDGILNNFARLIDPNDGIPSSFNYDSYVAVEQNGLPEVGSCAELKEYSKLLNIIEVFLAKYAGNSEDGYWIFALNSELEMVTRCMEWICENAGRSIRFRVLSLSRWTHLASTSKEYNRSFRRPEQDDPADTSTPRMNDEQLLQRFQRYIDLSIIKVGHAANRVFGESLTPFFHYPDRHPLTKYGVFLNEESVDEILSNNNNYKCFEELSCMYHMKRRDGAEFCALGIVNRYAFCLLDYLTMSNRVESIRKGSHFPVFYGLKEDERMKERERRYNTLGRWDLTELELNQTDEILERYQAAQKDQMRPRGRNPVESQRRSTNYQERPQAGRMRRSVDENGAQVEPAVRDEGGVRHTFSGDLPPAFRGLGLGKK